LIQSILIAMSVCAGLPDADLYVKACNAERKAQYTDAISAYEACAAKQGLLAPYAQLKAAFCRAASGEKDQAVEAYRRLIEKHPAGPWVRMAKTYLASLLSLQKESAQAAPLFTDALSFEPKPWWADQYDWRAADNRLLAGGDPAPAYAYFRYVVETTLYRKPRLDAAERLAKSAETDDRLMAAWGFFKCGEYPKTLKLLVELAPSEIKGEAEPIAWGKLTSALVAPDEDLKEKAAKRLAEIVEQCEPSTWTGLWLAYVARMSMTKDSMDYAKTVCDLLFETYPESEEAAYAQWLLAYHLANNDKTTQAVDAYLRMADRFPEHSRADDALFKANELLCNAEKNNDAVKPFTRLVKEYPDSRFVPYAWYWLGRYAQKAKKEEAAKECFQNAAGNHFGNFYAHRALQLLGEKKAGEPVRNLKVAGSDSFVRPLPAPKENPPELPGEIKNDPHVERLFFFAANGLEEAEWEALDLVKDLKGPNAGVIYQALAEAGLAFTAIEYAVKFEWGEEDGEPTLARRRLDYPRAYWPFVTKLAKETGLDPYLILAVARQESTYRPTLVSPVGATGMMQIMPDTAKWMAKVEPAVNTEHAAILESPENSIRIGAYYLMRMIERSDGNLVYALASYNAGPGNCDKWRTRFANVDLETFVESIPFGETNNYVKRVLANYAAYHSLYPPAN